MKLGEALEKAKAPVSLLVLVFVLLFVIYRAACAGI